MRRGEVWTAAGGAAYAGKPRPYIVVQDEVYLETDSIVVCPLTTEQVVTAFLRPPVDPEPGNGLEAKSRVMVDKIGAIPRVRMGKRLGKITAEQMRAVEEALGTFLGFAR